MHPMTEKFEYSIGKNTFDNLPSQFSVDNFQDFIEHILKVRGKAKGEVYFCSAFNYGHHDDMEKHPDQNHYRLAKNQRQKQNQTKKYQRSPSLQIKYRNHMLLLK